MTITKFPVRHVAVDIVPNVSIINGIVRLDFGSHRIALTLEAASGCAARVQDKLNALAKLQQP